MILLPLLPDVIHPGIDRLAELTADELGPLRLVELEVHGPDPVLLDGDVPGHKPSLPGWGVLRRLGGEVAEVLGVRGRRGGDGGRSAVGVRPLRARRPLFLTYLPGGPALRRLTGAPAVRLSYPFRQGARACPATMADGFR